MTGNVSDLNAEELDSILLDDPRSSQLRASNNAALGKLLSTVIALAKTSRTQMRRITGAIGEHVSALEKAPELIADSFAQGTSRTSTRTTEELEQLVHAVLDSDCTAVVAKLAHMAKVDDFLRKLEELLAGDVAEALDEAFSQAEHDDRCMRELADLLQVNSSDVVEEIKKLLAQRKDRHGAEFRGPGNVNERVPAPNQSTSTSRLGTSRIESTGPVEIPVGKSSSAAAKLSKAAEKDESQAKKKRGKRRRSRRKRRELSSIGNGADCLRMSIEGGHLPNLAQQVCRIGADSRLEKSPFTGRREIHPTANDVCDLEEHDFESPGMEKRRRNDEVQTALRQAVEQQQHGYVERKHSWQNDALSKSAHSSAGSLVSSKSVDMTMLHKTNANSGSKIPGPTRVPRKTGIPAPSKRIGAAVRCASAVPQPTDDDECF
ncbi:hypothetical protein ANCCAN_02442 [Ancylostoma caninum]|uniref:Uncharacterized protein n=1 Tax=Ancylostoma caninum TaxID=29170 RepID=A0A368H4F3_ANCCA|nr:hypothetical protein ANCCAN_02442 [Ancylostoma caninum]